MFILKIFYFSLLLSVLAVLTRLNKPLILIKSIKLTELTYSI